MICNNCKQKLPDDSEFCQYCGNKIVPVEVAEEIQNKYSEKAPDPRQIAREVDDLVEALEKLLADQLSTPTEFTCIEPDFIFELTPKEDLRSNPRFVYIRPGCEIADIDLEWKVFFWHEGLTGNYLSVALARPDIECLLTYLKVVTGRLSEKDEQVQTLIAKGILY